MNEPVPLSPPAYADVMKTSSSQEWFHKQAWYRKFIALEFSQDEAIEYAKLFVNNEIEIDMIPELNDDILKGIGIEKAGHRIRILRLQNKTPIQTASQRAVASPQPVVNVVRCAWHPQMAASEKCRTCSRLLCIQCRREKFENNRVRYYCQNCYKDCVIL